jgi:pimeloyl-ACP methyl ester carboxylesterase
MSLFDRFFSGEPLNLNSDLRRNLPGRFVPLSDGICHYDLAGPEDAPLVVLVHGFSVPYFIWDPTFEFLSNAGFRVLRYDLFGRGYSEHPPKTNNKAFFRRQLEELLAEVANVSELNIVSLSMGAVLAADFANQHPDRVAKLIFVDPAGFDLGLPWMVDALRFPILGEVLLGMLGLFGRKSLLQSMLSDFYDPSQEALDAFVPRYLEQMKYRGFKRSILSTLRSGLLDEDLAVFRALATSQIPIQLIWGREDKTVPFARHELFLDLLPQTQFHVIEKAGHIPHFERPEIVSPLLLAFLRS